MFINPRITEDKCPGIKQRATGMLVIVDGVIYQEVELTSDQLVDGFGPDIKYEWVRVTGIPKLIPVLQNPLAPPG